MSRARRPRIGNAFLTAVAAGLTLLLVAGCTSAAPAGSADGPSPESTPAGPAVATMSASTASPDVSPSPSTGSSDSEESEDITGIWDGIWTNDEQWGGATGGFTLTAEQDEQEFSGTIDVTGPTCVRHGTASGTVVDDLVTMGWVAARVRDVVFVGTIDEDVMEGTWTAIACDLDLEISGTWSATRR
jgi:hypothetical protein